MQNEAIKKIEKLLDECHEIACNNGFHNLAIVINTAETTIFDAGEYKNP